MGGGVVASCAATRRMGGGVQFRRRRASLALGSFCDVRQRRRCDEGDMPGLRLGHGGFSRDVRDARRPGSTCHRRRRAPRLPRVRRDHVQARPSRRDPLIPHEAARRRKASVRAVVVPRRLGHDALARVGIGEDRHRRREDRGRHDAQSVLRRGRNRRPGKGGRRWQEGRRFANRGKLLIECEARMPQCAGQRFSMSLSQGTLDGHLAFFML